MMTIETFLKDSPGKGVGVFTVNDIKKGDVVWKLDKHFVKYFTQEEVDEMGEIQKKYVHKYAHISAGRENIWEMDIDNTRWMNHSEDPNIEFDDEKGWAIMDIKAGDEMTCNYQSFDILPLDF